MLRNGVEVGSTTVKTFTDYGLTPVTGYSFSVKAVDAAGNQGPAATIAVTTLVTPPPPPPPPGLPPLWNASPPAGKCPAPTGPWVTATEWDAGTLATNELWDHFDGPAGSDPDPRLWQEDTINQGGVQMYNPAASFLDGQGHLVFEATRQSNGGIQSGRITSRQLFNLRYGWVAARIKFPLTEGTYGRAWWPGWWLLSVPADDPNWGEMDLIEFFGDTTVYSPTLWFPNSIALSGGHVPVPASHSGGNAGNDFHTYWLEWTADRIRIGVDDLITMDSTAASLGSNSNLWRTQQQPHYLIANFGINPGSVASDFPARMLIDWIWYRPLS